uniref:NADH dehydrogenase subunit 6 n=1 Tax=Complanledra complana TaxID=3078487 RepID=A0AAU6PBW3_9HEMI
MLKLIFFCSFLSCFLLNPMSMGMLLMFYSFLICCLIGKVMLTSWFCISVVLSMVGGLLVIFMYISSISTNDKFKLSFLSILFFIFCFFYLDEFFIEYNCVDNMVMNYELNLSEIFSLVKLYNYNCLCLTVFTIIYLIFTMVVVSNIIKHSSGPLRSFNYEQIFTKI